MFQKIVIVIVFSFSVGLVGCRSCWGPYDRCQPTFVPEAGDQCMGELYRNGSVLGGMDRRTNESGCSSCAGGTTDADDAIIPVNHYEAVEASEAAPAQSQYSESDEPFAEPLPERVTQPSKGQPQPQPLPMDEFLPSGANLPEQFPLSDDAGTL